jgi:hypothetical protein
VPCCTLVDRYQHFRGAYCFHFQLVPVYQTTPHHIQENSSVLSHCCVCTSNLMQPRSYDWLHMATIALCLHFLHLILKFSFSNYACVLEELIDVLVVMNNFILAFWTSGNFIIKWKLDRNGDLNVLSHDPCLRKERMHTSLSGYFSASPFPSWFLYFQNDLAYIKVFWSF